MCFSQPLLFRQNRRSTVDKYPIFRKFTSLMKTLLIKVCHSEFPRQLRK